MHAFSYAWSLPARWRRWRSHHSIRHILKPHVTRKLHGSMFYITRVIADWSFFYIAEIGIFDLICSCDLDLNPMACIYEIDPYSLKTYWMCKYELTSRLSKLESHRLTDRQTRPKLNTMPLRGWSIEITSDSLNFWWRAAGRAETSDG